MAANRLCVLPAAAAAADANGGARQLVACGWLSECAATRERAPITRLKTQNIKALTCCGRVLRARSLTIIIFPFSRCSFERFRFLHLCKFDLRTLLARIAIKTSDFCSDFVTRLATKKIFETHITREACCRGFRVRRCRVGIVETAASGRRRRRRCVRCGLRLHAVVAPTLSTAKTTTTRATTSATTTTTTKQDYQREMRSRIAVRRRFRRRIALLPTRGGEQAPKLAIVFTRVFSSLTQGV